MEKARLDLEAASAAAQDACSKRDLVEAEVRRLESQVSEGAALLDQQTLSLKHAAR